MDFIGVIREAAIMRHVLSGWIVTATTQSAVRNLLHIKRNACSGVKLGRGVTLSECREVMETIAGRDAAPMSGRLDGGSVPSSAR